MRSRALLFTLLALSCRSSTPPTPPPPATTPVGEVTPPARADASVAAPSGPCGVLMAEGARALDALRRRFPQGGDAWPHVAALNHCEATPGGAWATVLVAPAASQGADAGDAPLEGLFKLVHVTRDGARAEALPRIDKGDGFRVSERDTNWVHNDIVRTEMGPWTLFDYDDEGEPEVIIPFTTNVSEQGTTETVIVWKVAPNGVAPYDAAASLSPVGVEDVDRDGRPDLYTYARLEGEYTSYTGVNAWLHGPRLVAWSQRGGGFVTSSGVALERNRALCPSAPTAYFTRASSGGELGAAANNVGCARLWGVPTATIEQALARECPENAERAGPSCEDGMRGLRAMARVNPMADLRPAVSFRRAELPQQDAGTGEDVPRGRYTLTLEGVAGGAPPTLDLGEQTGVCGVREGAARQNEVAILHCWWAGAGVEHRVVRRGAQLTVQKRDVSEESGPGAWRDVGRVAVPANAALRPGEILDAR